MISEGRVIFTKALSVAMLLVLATACSSNKESLIKIDGEAQGTTWHIAYLSDQGTNYKSGIDSLLTALDSSLSTYLPASIISRINSNDGEVTVDRYFVEVFNKSMEVSKKTGGLFDVTVGPLVNAWGFGFTKKANIDSAMIDSLLDLVDYKMLSLQGNKLVKTKPQIIIDFNAIAQGYSVDILADFLESKNINNYLIELGGEIKAKGKKNGESWKVGIDQPDENNTTERRLEAIIELNNKALATSGNYRKFYEEDGEKYAHILDPRSGYPAKQNLLSATVLASDAITADAYATAFMVMGLSASKEFLSEHTDLNLEVYFIYSEDNSWKIYSSESLKKLITKVH
ncbi:MAG: FAD:protein FMN transferase [Daejeonella sp.]